MFSVRLKKLLWVSLGTFSLILGVGGIFLPLLPTTPFLLLTSFCYFRGSQLLHNWLLEHKVFGPIIADYLKQRAISRRTKVTALTLLWPSLVFSMLLVEHLALRLFLTLIGTAVTIHILRLKEKEGEKI